MSMATGTSVIGLQRLIGITSAENGSFTLDIAVSASTSRLVRHGTLIRCQEGTNPVRFRTVRVWKLYGQGLIVARDAIALPFNIPTALWVSWFTPGLSWTVDTL